MINNKNKQSDMPQQEIPVMGAYEDFEGNHEQLITLTRTGELLRAGDYLPSIPGIDLEGNPFIVHIVNALGTETCDQCIDELEVFHQSYPSTPIYTITKQSTEEISAEDAKRAEAGKVPVTHTRLNIDNDTAINLGVALAPGAGADVEFWPTALRRTLALVDSQGIIVDIQQPENQEQLPDFQRVYNALQSIS